jgi:hypothetical protein
MNLGFVGIQRGLRWTQLVVSRYAATGFGGA